MVPSPAAIHTQLAPVTRPRVDRELLWPAVPSFASIPSTSQCEAHTMTSKVLASPSHGLERTLGAHPELDHLASTMPSTTIDSVRSQSRMSISHAKGLLNYPGQNNCFLNSAVQVLWHLDIFRRSFRELHGHACMGDSCIFCALKELFNQFQSSKESALPPDSLRFALAEAFSDQRRFQMGFMDDAAECFENILLRIHYHLTNQEVSDSSTHCLPHCITHQKFAMNLCEQMVCHSCGATSEPFVFSQMVHYASTTALCSQEKLFKSDTLSFGSLLKMTTTMGDVRNCPRLCGARISIKKVLVNRPDVLSVCLVWDSEHATLPLIRNVFQLIETSIRLDEVFDHSSPLPEPQRDHQLVGLVTYYGKHYSTYLYNTNRSEWIYFDDATVRVIGPSWQQVVDKCLKGRFQPLLLLYANPNGAVVNTQFALTNVIPMTAIKTGRPAKQTIITGEPINGPTCPIQSGERIKAANSFKETNYFDVPDSPSATSTTSYFSDMGDSTDGYISRKAVENILKIQQHKHRQTKEQHELVLPNILKKSNRNSSSSLDSFDSALRMNTLPRTKESAQSSLACFLQRRDSGNSSGDRSSSVSSVDTPYYNQYRRPLKSVPRKPSKPNSDQGYDSFSLSSTDSYPSAATTSPSKLSWQTLKQIPEDVQLLESIRTSSECDQLCSEVDILLLKSAQMEREGDLRAAAALSDSAAAKARIAMDAPYSNHQALISAKMKHSICVMRSASLHKRVQEMEEEEKRHIRAAQEYHHSRQSSRDSTHGRHSRQGSRDGKDPSPKAPTIAKLPPNLEIYATLPKKAKRKSLFKTSTGHLAPEEAACVESSAMLPNNSILLQLKSENIQNPLSDAAPKSTELLRESDFSDYYSEWEGLKKKSSNRKDKSNNGSGWQSCRENDSEIYGEVGLAPSSAGRKQCKVKRKLLLGGLLKSKNRSMPDLREDSLREKDCSGVALGGEEGAGRTTVANIRAKGFHQSHRSFVTEQGLSSKPALVKVKPPLISGAISTQAGNNNSENDSIYANINYCRTLANPPVDSPAQQETRHAMDPLPLTNQSTNPFLLEINKKRREILKRYESSEPNYSNLNDTVHSNDIPISAPLKKPLARQIVNFISTSINMTTNKDTLKRVPSTNNSSRRPEAEQSRRKVQPVEPVASQVVGSIHMPIPIHAAGMAPQGLATPASQARPSRPPDYETALRRIEMRSASSDRPAAFPVPPAVGHCRSARPLKPSGTLGRVAADLSGERNQSLSLDRAALHATKAPAESGRLCATDNRLTGAKFTDNLDRRRTLPKKKSVKFSDHIELVACADDDDPEEHLPNPLLEKVLTNKSVVYTLKQ